MTASVTITLSVAPEAKHRAQMRLVAKSLTVVAGSVRISRPAGQERQLNASFSVPDSRQGDVVDRIGRAFWMVENYADCSIGFGPRSGSVRRAKGAARKGA